MFRTTIYLAPLAALALSSCASRPEPAAAAHSYLEGIGSPISVTTFQPSHTATESHWDGDGIAGSPKIVIDLSNQKASFYKDDHLVGVSPISSGTSSHPTPTGKFKVTQKNIDHRSSWYGDYVDREGNVVVKDIDNRKDRRPSGTRYLGADMGYFMRFNGPIGMHRGFLPGYPASHGCIRLPEEMAAIFFDHASIGTPVIVAR